ncbi:MAG: cofactor-independent phosphoglycerate mutase [Candidatus Solincola sediminis]|uniref:Cofactor-independent phosphoglycerate mutase n=1 Tax=Candidatus Solincola sediminis TaxID=1797199 RepID=A0A1F2WF48_9ACTN|nr:MAG: cofactor-independent phosphoglycerate mutase [Candidatus Solincola sediminis]OFW57843.1 MAG: cofactor-independent phosphoglycerate mutase [Candidatus Solincola sediminis]
MKYIVLVPDGAADLPVERYGGLTPLQAAATPNMDFLAKNGICGTAVTIPPGMPAGSDVANCSILGYDPRLFYSGRGPLEAASMGIGLGPEDVAFRCNLVTEESGVLVDFSAGHISSQEAAELIAFLNERLGDATGSFYAGISYRHLLVLSGNRFLKTRCIPPHDVVGSRVKEISPQGEGAEQLVSLMEKSRPLLTDHPVNKTRLDRSEKPANMIWPWGQGKTPALPTIPEKYGIEGSIITAVDLLKGLGLLAGLERIHVPGATGYYDTDYEAKGLYAVEALSCKDLVYVHVEAPDEAGHEGDWEAKVKAIECFDRLTVATLLNEISRISEDFRFLLLPDHATPVEARTHTADAVPFALYGLDIIPDAGSSFDEEGVLGGSLLNYPGWQLLDLAIGSQS